jgi:glycogen synthase
MRILVWSEDYWPRIGGIEVLTTRLVGTLKERGHDVLVITRRDGDQLSDETRFGGVLTYHFPFWPALTERNVDRMTQIARRVAEIRRAFQPDLVHMHSIRPGSIFYQLTAATHPAPLLVTFHGFGADRDGMPDTVLDATLRTADWATACSAAVLEHVRRLLPYITQRSSVVANGLEMPAIPVEPLPFDQPRLLCLGRADPCKGWDVALEAFVAVHRRHPTARLVVAGDGAARNELEALACGLGIEESVDFLGWVHPDNVPGLINSCTMVVMPSRQEAFGLVALQAAQMGRPIVASRAGGIPEVVADGQTGILVEVDDRGALAGAIESLLDHPHRARCMGESARRRAEGEFSMERCADDYEALYRKLIGGREGVGVGVRA